jgi:N-acetylmuramoyl-L-alanine amidase
LKITVNAGHGATDPGAIGQNGLEERDVTKAVALLVCDLLKAQGHEVQFIQSDSLADICDLSNEWQSDVFLSIHCNAAENPAANGFEVWTSFGETKADELAECIYTEMLALPLNGRKDTSDGDSDKECGFYVLRYTDCLAALIELAFISNAREEALLASPDFQNQCAEAIVNGIKNYGGM